MTASPWNATTRDIYAQIRTAAREETRAAVATVVDVEGSAYRRPGAKAYVPADGDVHGAVTAGCLEGRVAELAAAAIGDGESRTERFDLRNDSDEGVWGLGVGCNGVIDLLVEPADTSWAAPLDAVLDERRVLTLVSVIESDDPTIDVGAREVVHESEVTDAQDRVDGDGTASTDVRPQIPAGVVDSVREQAHSLAGTGTASRVQVSRSAGDVTVLIDGLDVPPELLVFGHHHDVHAVARLARQVGFRVTVATGRGDRATPEDFPNAHRVVSTNPTAVADEAGADQHTYAVVMSHNFVDDRLAVESLLENEVPYVGLMGPRKRFEEMRDAFAEEGTRLSREQLDRLSTPVGLDLGGDEPTQIALSIVSEVLAVTNELDGGRLRERDGPIHTRQ